MVTKQRVVNSVEELIAQEDMRDAVAAVEPVIQKGTIIEEGTPMMMGDTVSAGMVLLYDTRTGVSSRFHKNNLKNGLARKREDGSIMYTARDPHITDNSPKHLCWLHPNHPNRPHYNTLGLGYCNALSPERSKSNLRSVQHVRVHMMKKHKNEWEAIEADRRNSNEAEERQLRQLTISRMMEQEAPVAQATPAPVAQEAPVVKAPKVAQAEVSGQCPKCAEAVTGKGEFGLKTAMRWHDKRKHA